MNIDKDFFWGIGIGVLAGALGYKLYADNKQTIMESLNNIKNKLGSESSNCTEPQIAGITDDSESEPAEIDLAELEKQKEHLEDLIAEQQCKKSEA
jgi:hypothetical protein